MIEEDSRSIYDRTFEREILQKRLEKIHSYRYIQIEHTVRIQELELQLSITESLNKELNSEIKSKDIKLQNLEEKCSLKEVEITELMKKNSSLQKEYSIIHDRFKEIHEDKTRTKKYLVDSLNKSKSYINNFQSLCLLVANAMEVTFGSSSTLLSSNNCSLSGVDIFYQQIIEILQRYKDTKDMYIEEFYELCDGFINLLQRFAIINKQLSTVLQQHVDITLRAKIKIEDLIRKDLEENHSLALLSREIAAFIDSRLRLYPEQLAPLQSAFTSDYESTSMASQVRHLVLYLFDTCNLFAKEMNQLSIKVRNDHLENLLQEHQTTPNISNTDKNTNKYTPYSSEKDEEPNEGEGDSHDESVKSIRQEWTRIKKKHDAQQTGRIRATNSEASGDGASRKYDFKSNILSPI